VSRCQWCWHPGNEDEEATTLCRTHEAEREGVSEAELDRMDREMYADLH
jgi:hypothetical protein